MIQELLTKVTIVSHLAASPARIWSSVSGFDGVNREMSPFLRMSPPDGVTLENATVGEVIDLNLTGPLNLPLGTYPLRLVEVEIGSRFLEQTQMLPFLLWQHERTISSHEDGTQITDSLGWRWRAQRLDPILIAGVRRFFTHRHRRLRQEFGEIPV